MSRFAGFPHPTGLVVLDQETGEVVLVPSDGSATRVLREPVAANVAPRPASGDAAKPERADEPLDREVLATFPLPIAVAYERFLHETDPRLRCKALVDTFSVVLKLWAFALASDYLRHGHVKDALVNETLGRDLARPLLSAYNLLIARSLAALRDAGIEPFCPEMATAYEVLEGRCREPFFAEVRCEDASGAPTVRRSRLGKIQALIRYRNGLAHGSTTGQDRAAADLETYTPVLRDVLREARFMARYTLHAASQPRSAEGAVLARRLMGNLPSRDLEAVSGVDFDPRDSPTFLRDERTERVLPLSVFVDVGAALPEDETPDVLLFEGCTKSAIVYVSHGGDFVEKRARHAAYAAALARKAIAVPRLSAATLTLDALRAGAARATRATLERLVSSLKYVREASVDRPALAEQVAQFELGDYRGLVIGGESGGGKTTFLARTAEARMAAGDVVLFYRAASLSDANLAGRVLRDLGLSDAYFEDVLAAMDSLFCERGDQGGPRLRVLVDGINEHADPPALVAAIDAMVGQAASHPWFRLVASIRRSSYERLPAESRFGRVPEARYLTVEQRRGPRVVRTPLLPLPPLAESEVSAMYERYRELRRRDPDDPDDPGSYAFRPSTAASELDPRGSTFALLRSPLMMRLVLAAFHRRELPPQISYDQAMNLYVEAVVVERDGPDGAFPERLDVLRAIVRELDRCGTDQIERDRLYQIDKLKRALQNPGRDSAYVQLLEIGILLEEWESDRCTVRFAFDRLFEYLLGELHDPHVDKPADVLRLAARAPGFRSLRGALESILVRASRQGRVDLVADALDRSDESEQRVMVQAARATLELLARSRDPAYDTLVAALVARPGPADVEVLIELFDRLFLLGEVSAAERALAACRRAADELGAPGPRAEVAFRVGRGQRLAGELEAALASFADARDLARAAGDTRVGFAADVERAQVLDDRGRIEEAVELLAAAAEAAETTNDKVVLAASLRALGLLWWRRGDLDKARALTARSLALHEEQGDRLGVGKCLNNLGIVSRARGDIAGAEACYARSLEIWDELGDKRGLRIGLSNMGVLARERGDLETAERHFRRSLAVGRELGDRQGTATSLVNLGVLASDRRDFDAAVSLHGEAVEIYTGLGDAREVAYCRALLASVFFEAGRASSANDELVELRRDAATTSTPKLRLMIAALELRSAVRGGDRKTIEKHLAAVDARLSELPGRAAVEESPIDAWLEAAKYWHGSGAAGRACELAARAEAALGGRFYGKRRELDGVTAIPEAVASS